MGQPRHQIFPPLHLKRRKLTCREQWEWARIESDRAAQIKKNLRLLLILIFCSIILERKALYWIDLRGGWGL